MSSSKAKSPKAASTASSRGSKGGDDGESEGKADFKPAYKSDARADEMMKQAEKKLGKSSILSVFSSSNKYEDAVEIILKAAAQYKVSKNCQSNTRQAHMHCVSVVVTA